MSWFDHIRSTHACFDCHWTARLPPTWGSVGFPCVKCGKPMHDMGRRFRTPKKNDTRGWKAEWERHKPYCHCLKEKRP
jgi:hypothetical protein